MNLLLLECGEEGRFANAAVMVVACKVHSFYNLFLYVLAPKVDYMASLVLMYS